MPEILWIELAYELEGSDTMFLFLSQMHGLRAVLNDTGMASTGRVRNKSSAAEFVLCTVRINLRFGHAMRELLCKLHLVEILISFYLTYIS